MAKTQNKNKTVKKTTTTTAPDGLRIERSGTSYKCSWKRRGKDYGAGQIFEWSLDRKKWHRVSVSNSATSKSITAGKVKAFVFRVRGRQKPYKTTKNKVTTEITPNWSGWSTKAWYAEAPATPKVEDSYSDGTYEVSWSVDDDKSSKRVLTNVICQYLTTKTNTSGSSLPWRSAKQKKADAEGKMTFTLARSSQLVQWVRIYAIGPGGQTGYKYLHHAFTTPLKPTLSAGSAVISGTTSTRLTTRTTVRHSLSKPVDTLTLQYCITEPTIDMKLPSGANFSDGVEDKITRQGTIAQVYQLDSIIGENEAIFLRSKVEHDGYEVYSDYKLVSMGNVSAPTFDEPPTVSGEKITVNAENNCNVDGSFLAVVYQAGKFQGVTGIIPKGKSEVSFTIPGLGDVKAYRIGVYAVVGTYSKTTLSGGISGYTVTPKKANGRLKKSSVIWQRTSVAGTVPVTPPANVTAVKTDDAHAFRVSWDWTWADAVAAELSWSDSEDAWESTNDPNTYQINSKVTSWIVSDLEGGEKGTRYFVKVRLLDEEGNASPWSEAVYVDVAADPDTPDAGDGGGGGGSYSDGGSSDEVVDGGSVDISSESMEGELTTGTTSLATLKRYYIVGQPVTLSWTYSNSDGTSQDMVEIENVDTGDVQKVATDKQTTTITATESMTVRVRVTSTAGKVSGWSEPLTINVIPKLSDVTFTADGITDGVLADLPITITAWPADAPDASLTSTAVITRDDEYHLTRPNDRRVDGYAGEVVAMVSSTSPEPYTISYDDIIGYLDDGATYTLTMTVKDSYGQVQTKVIPFTVNWTKKATMPTVKAEVDIYDRVTMITVTNQGADAADRYDLYRLSADAPVLIAQDCKYGETYVDPYPAFGELGGHRIVAHTPTGCYTTADDMVSIVDIGEDDDDIIEESSTVIEFNGQTLELAYNVQPDSTWTKDFQRTVYLNGAVTGDWNPGVTRDINVGYTGMTVDDVDQMKLMRQLAAYPGICHIRTPEGSSLYADIQVSESLPYDSIIASYTLSVQAVDAQGMDAMTLAEWKETR